MGASLQEELSAALDGAELPSGDVSADIVDSSADTSIESAPVDSGTESSSGRDASGRFVGKQAEQTAVTGDQPAVNPAQTDANQQPQDQQAGDAKSIVTPPATWSAGAKAIYSQLPEVARKEIAKRERDYAVGIQQYAERAKIADSFMREVQPYEAMIRAEGATPERALGSFLKQAYILRTASPQQKGELIMQVAQKYGADLSQFIGQQQEQAAGNQDLSQVQQLVQQLVSPHLQKIQQWEMQQTTAQQQQQMQMEQEIQGQITAFQSATNEDGSPKHLYFENVRPAMSALMGNGQAKTLEQAYEMACWANPEVRSALIADQQRAAEAKRLEEAKRKAQDAGRAGFNVSGQGGVGIAGATQSSLRDDLSAQLEAALGGQRV